MSKIKFNDNLIKRNILEVGLSKEQKITSISNTDVQFDIINIQVGEDLTLENGKIKIGKGIKYVKVNYTLWLENPTGYVSHHITKNGVGITYNIDPLLDINSTWHTSNGSTIIEVSEGDLIGIQVRFATANTNNKLSHYANSNRLIVEAI